MPKIKLNEVEAVLNILNPVLTGKCGGLLSLDIIDLINELTPHAEKVQKIKDKIVKDYAEKDEEGNYKTIKNEQGLDLHTFGENKEKVEEELQAVSNQEVKVDKLIDTKNIDNDVRIEPLGLKFLFDLGLLKR